MAELSDLGLRGFPFSVVPPTGPVELWAARTEFHKDLRKLVGRWSLTTNSDITLLWAAFGSGKTHALRHLEWLCAKNDPPILAVYTDLPQGAKSFVEVYQQIVRRFPEDVLSKAVMELASTGSEWLDHPCLDGDRDTPRALQIVSQLHNHPMADAARKWLRAAGPTASELKTIGGLTKISNADQAVRTLRTLCQMIVTFTDYKRVAVFVDEFQRIGAKNVAHMRQINAGVHTWFNSCPSGLSILLSYSIGERSAIEYFVTPEVYSRVGRTLTLELLDQEEAARFVRDLLSAYGESSEWSIFLPEAIDVIVAAAIEEEGGIPRAIMHRAGKVLEEILLEDLPTPVDAANASLILRR